MSLNSQKQAILFSHPGCPPFAQQAARAFYDAGLLSAYVTTFAYRPRTNFGRYLKGVYGLFSGSANQELSRRQITELPDEMVITHPSRELLRTFVSRSRLGPIAADYVWENAELWFDRRVSRHHLHNARAVYGYEHAVLETFSKQRARGALNIYDMPTAHHKLKSAMLDTEVSAVPEGQTTYVRHVQRNRSRRNERTDAELALADLIICPSQFVRNSLVQVGVNPEKILVVPFGSPTVATLHGKHSNKSMIFLSAGNQSISKGTHYLLEAWRKLKPPANCELWLVGKMALPERLLVNMMVSGDFEMWVRLSERWPTGFLNESLLLLRSHEEQFSRRKGIYVQFIKEDREIVDTLLRRLPLELRSHARRYEVCQRQVFYFHYLLRCLLSGNWSTASQTYREIAKQSRFGLVALIWLLTANHRLYRIRPKYA